MAGWHIRLGLLLLLQGLQAFYLPKDEQWNASIEVQWQPRTQILFIMVHPLEKGAASLRVCVRRPISHTCEGHVQLSESPPNIFRYAVTELKANTTFVAAVKPYDKNNVSLDVWIQYPYDVFTEVLASTGEIPSDDKGESGGNRKGGAEETDPEKWAIIGFVFLVAIFAAAAAVVVIYCLWRRGQFTVADVVWRIWFLGCCLRRIVQTSRVTEVLQLYAAENEQLIQLVKNHADLLKRHMPLHVLDCGEVRNKPDARQWLQNNSAQRRVIVYVTPQLIRELKKTGDDDDHVPQGDDNNNRTRRDPLARICVQLILERSRSGGEGGRKPVLIVTGCFPNDVGNDNFLRQQPSLRGLSRFWLSRDQVLRPPHALLSKLSGFHRSFFTSSRDWSQGFEAVLLKRAVGELWWQMNEVNRQAPPQQPPRVVTGCEIPVEEEYPLLANQNVDKLQQNFENPRPNLDHPPLNQEPRSQILEHAEQNFEHLQGISEHPQRNFEQPHLSREHPQQNFEHHQQNFEHAPQQNFELRQQNFGHHQQNVGHHPQNCEHLQQNFKHRQQNGEPPYSIPSDYDPTPPEESEGEDSDSNTSEEMRELNDRSGW